MDLKDADLTTFNENYLLNLNPWFRSIGFDMKVSVDKMKDKELYKEYYCKAMINNRLYRTFFEMRGIEKPYHFLLNGQSLEKNRQRKELKELFAVFLNKEYAYSISFDFYIPMEGCRI